MDFILRFIARIFTSNVLALFLITSYFLIFFDCRDFKKNNYIREYKLARFFGYLYAIAGIVFYIIGLNVKL